MKSLKNEFAIFPIALSPLFFGGLFFLFDIDFDLEKLLVGCLILGAIVIAHEEFLTN